jgi:hypothetical protein
MKEAQWDAQYLQKYSFRLGKETKKKEEYTVHSFIRQCILASLSLHLSLSVTAPIHHTINETSDKKNDKGKKFIL